MTAVALPIAMGVTTLAVEVANPAKPEVRQRVEFIVDSGATYSVVPAPVLRRLKIEALGLALDPIRRELKPVTLLM